MNSSIRALLAVVSAASVALATVSVAVDASTACTGQTNKFAGTDPRGPNNFGASAYIGKRVPALCGATYSVSAIWAMSAAYSNGGYAQAGYVRFQGQSTVYPFGEARQDYGHNYQRRTLIVTIPAGTTKYWESYNVQAHKTTAYWNDGSTTWNLLDTFFDPLYAWNSPWQSSWNAEVHDLGDDVPGTSSAKARFSSMQIATSSSGGSWQTPSGLTISSDSSRYAVQWVSSQSSFDVWTQ